MAHVDEMAKAAEALGYGLTVLAEDPDMYGDCGDARMVRFPTRDSSALRRYVADHRDDVANVFSVTDMWGVAASELRDEFGFPQFLDTAKLRRLRDKAFVQNTLRDAGLLTADIGDHWPRIVKPRNGTGKIGVRLVPDATTQRELARQGAWSDDIVSQPYYRGPLYSAEVWADGDRFLLMGVTNRIMAKPPVFLELVKSFPWSVQTQWERTVGEWVGRILAAVGYDLGLAHVEFIETSHGFELVEINCRMAGSLITPAILYSTNCNPYRMVVEQALGGRATLPHERTVRGGYSHVSVYADRPGTVAAVCGAATLTSYPGHPQWHQTRGVGAAVEQIGTYRARIGDVSAVGPDAATAQDRAIAASRCIEVRVA